MGLQGKGSREGMLLHRYRYDEPKRYSVLYYIIFPRTPSPPMTSLDFRGFDSGRLLILRVGILTSVEFDRGSPGKFDSRTLNRETRNRWTGRNYIDNPKLSDRRAGQWLDKYAQSPS